MNGPPPMRRALAMLAKAPLPGCVKTRLVPPLSVEEAAALALGFATDCATRFAALARTLGAAAFLYYSPDDAADFCRSFAGDMTLRPQGTGDLGTRMCAIVTALRTDQFEHIVLVGADSPTLPDAHIAAAFDALDDGMQVAIAAAADGGYVLLGVDRPHAELFEAIPWSTHLVYEASVTRARAANLAVCELPGWFDVERFRPRDVCASIARADPTSSRRTRRRR